MPRKDDSKRRVLAIERMFQTGRPLTTAQILRKLDLEYDIRVDRKTIYSDICELTWFMPIEKFSHGRSAYYQLIKMEVNT